MIRSGRVVVAGCLAAFVGGSLASEASDAALVVAKHQYVTAHKSDLALCELEVYAAVNRVISDAHAASRRSGRPHRAELYSPPPECIDDVRAKVRNAYGRLAALLKDGDAPSKVLDQHVRATFAYLDALTAEPGESVESYETRRAIVKRRMNEAWIRFQSLTKP